MDFLLGGNGMFLMGEHSGFMHRNDTILFLIEQAGGGTLTFAPATDSQQEVLPPADGPNPLPGNEITYPAVGGVTNAGNGQCLTRDSNGNCGAIAFGRGTLTNTPDGSLTAVFDVNFMQGMFAGQPLGLFLENLIQFVTSESGGGGGSDFRIFAHTPYQGGVASSLNKLFGHTTGEISQLMTAIAGLPEGQEEALSQLGNNFTQTPSQNGQQALYQHFVHVLDWMETPHIGGSSSPVMSYAATSGLDVSHLMAFSRTGGARPTWSNGQGFNVFASGSYLNGSQGGTLNRLGSDYHGYSLTGGFTYGLNEAVTLGAAVGYTHIGSDLDLARGKARSDTYTALAFGRYEVNGFYADLMGNAALLDYSYDRHINIAGIRLTAEGSTDGWQAGVTARTGYDFTVATDGQSWRMMAGPFAQLQYLHQNFDGFTETGVGTASLIVGSQKADSLAARLGLRVAGAVQSGNVVWTPSASLAYERLAGGAGASTMAFTGGPTAPFVVPVDKGDRDFAVIGLGLAAAMADTGISLKASYDGRLGGNDHQHAFTARLSARF